MYLLAKKLPHTLVSDQNDEFKKLLAETEAKDIVAFAQAVKSADSTIDGKVCNKKVHSGKASDVEYARWSCETPGTSNTDSTVANKFSVRFGDLKGASDRKTKHDGNGSVNPTRGWPGGPEGTETADGIAGDLSGLQRHEKSKVAGLLSKTISGAEVVEIRAVSTTSVMCNACYDL